MGKNSKRMKIDGRTYRVTLDKFLADKQLKRKSIAKDGSCLFRAVSEQVYGSQCYHHKVRLKCIEYIGAHRDDFKEFITMPLDKYLALLSKELWGGEVELVVLSRLYSRSIVVYNELIERREVQEQVFPSVEDDQNGAVDKLTNPILLAYSDRNHYDSVFSTQYMEDTSFCQGLVYTMLMERVFKQHISLPCKRKLGRLHESDINSITKHSYGQDKYDAREHRVFSALSRYRVDVVIAMSWTLHHNAALSLHRWEKDGVEQRDRHMAASIQFHVGNRCHFYIDGKRINGEISSLNVKPGCHSVRVYQSQKESQSQKERLVIHEKDITLLSSHSTASGKQGKPHPSGEQSGGSWKDARSRQYKESSPATEASSSTQSILGPPPVTVNSPTPPGSMKKGKAAAPQTQQTERAQKSSKRQSGNSGPVTTPRQEQNRINPGTAKTDPVGVSPAVPGAGLPRSATLGPKLTTPVPYSSVVKKTAGGPSGSLTSEGTEYDESSDEAAQDENKEIPVLESSKFPVSHQSQQQQDAVPHKPTKPLLVGRSRGHTTLAEDDNAAKEKPMNVNSTPSGFQQSGAHDTTPILIPQSNSPYLDPQIPQGASSQPQDAWPEIPQAPCSTISPQNTMIYAAVMTNRNNQEQESPIASSTHFPYSTPAADNAHFPKTFSPQHSRVTNPPVTFPLQTAAAGLCLGQALPQPSSTSDHTASGMEAGLRYPLPGGHHHIPFQTSMIPAASPAYGVLPRILGTSSEIYSTAMIQRASSSPQVGGYNSNRSPRMSEAATNHLPLQGAANAHLPYQANCTVAAGMEVRNMLGIEGRQSANPPVYVGSSNNFQTVVPTSLPHHKTGPVIKDSDTQTLQPAISEKEVQVRVEVITQGVQTVVPLRSNSETQTEGLFVPREDLEPQDIQLESVADRLLFAVKYSLQCLSAFSHTTTGDGNGEVEEALKELLDTGQIEQLVEQAAQNNNLVASQQNFMRSPGDMLAQQGGYGGDRPQSAEFSRNEDVAPQQEQHHLMSPGIPRMNVPPSFPFMIPPHPFMMPPPHPRMFYHPIMTHMPPMGYAPMVPPPMLPHQIVPPRPLSPGIEARIGEQGGVIPTPDNAHHNFPVQDQLQQDEIPEVNGETPQQFPQPAHSSEMVASSVYPIPPSAMVVQTNGPPTIGADTRQDEVDGIPLQQQDSTVQQDIVKPDDTLPTVASSPANRSTTEEATETKATSPFQKQSLFQKQSPFQKQSLHSTTQAAPTQKGQKGSRKSSQSNANSGMERPPVGETAQPGLPCRPSSNVPKGGHHQHSRRYSGKGQGGGENQQRAMAKSKTGGTRNRKAEVEEKAASSVDVNEGGKKEASSKRTSRTRVQDQDHTGSPTVSGPSTNKSNQDPTRNFAPAFDRSRSRSSSSSTSCAPLYTKYFKWGVPSPGANPDDVLDSAPASDDTNCEPEPAKSEWPDIMSELGVSSSYSRNYQQQAFAASLKFTNSPTPPVCYPKEQSAAVGEVCDSPNRDHSKTDSIEDPFPAVHVAWQSDLGDYPLTLSPSQSTCLAQCTGDLNKLVTNLHKH